MVIIVTIADSLQLITVSNDSGHLGIYKLIELLMNEKSVPVSDLCPPPPLLTNTDIIKINRRDKGKTSYKCKEGYHFPDDKEVWEMECESLIWKSYPPKCIGKMVQDLICIWFKHVYLP